MNIPTSVRLPDGSGEIPLLNQGFEISPEAARELWAEGRKMPDPEDGSFVSAKDQVLQSADGRWVIHRLDRLEAAEAAAIAMEEFDQLQEHGIDVISRSLTPSLRRQAVFAVTPYIPGLLVCNEEIFETRIAGKLQGYFRSPRNGKRLTDVNRYKQYSLLPEAIEPFLHDTHPYLSSPKDS